jgi:CheY-like chemotaxis protein
LQTFVQDQILNSRPYPSRLNFALVIDEANPHRHAVIALLREHGWLVHGVSCAEHAFNILVHIPYTLLVLDSKLPGIGAMDFVRVVRASGERQAIQLVIINSSESANWENQIAESGAFLVRRSRWRDDLSGFLVAHGEDSQMSNACSRI